MDNKATNIAILLLASAMALTACGSNSEDSGQQINDSANTVSNTNMSDALAGKDGKTVVTVSVPTNDRLMQQAEQAFEQAHPDIDIQIDAISTEAAGKQNVMKTAKQPGQVNPDVEKYRTTVNTAIMSGKADDLIAVQDLNCGSYADKGLLADLGALIDKDAELQNGDVNKQVLDAMKRGGHRYTLPVDFGLNLMVGNQDAIVKSDVNIDDTGWTWEQFFDLGKQAVKAGGGQQAILSTMSERDLFSSMLRSTYSNYVDDAAKKASFDSTGFIAMMTGIKEMADQGLVRTGPDKSADDLFKQINASSPITLLFFSQMYYNGKSKVYSTPGEGNGGSLTFTPGLMFAMNDKSEVKDAAWQFLQFLLSDQVQSNPALSGIPVRKSSLKKVVGSLSAKLSNGNVKIQTKDGGTQQQPAVTDDDLKLVEQIAAQAGTYVYEDFQVMTIAQDEADAFFKGEKSAADAAKSIQNRVSTYLNE